MELRDVRTDYTRDTLLEQDCGLDPFHLMRLWLDDALQENAADANAMTLATVDAEGQPTARVLLIKDLDARGIVWFTHYTSRKGRELQANPKACLLFFWPQLQRQVRVEGMVEHVSAAESDAYWRSRPLESRWGALASPQSQVIPDRDWLEQNLNRQRQAGGGDAQEPTRPAHWGGYRLIPQAWEFWQGRASRLHDRLVFRRDPSLPQGWRRERLAP